MAIERPSMEGERGGTIEYHRMKKNQRKWMMNKCTNLRMYEGGRVGGVREQGVVEHKEYVPGNSVSDTGERMNGGAVIDERSPENEAILHPHPQPHIHTHVRPTHHIEQRTAQHRAKQNTAAVSTMPWCDWEGGGRGTYDLRNDVQLLRCAEGTAYTSRQ